MYTGHSPTKLLNSTSEMFSQGQKNFRFCFGLVFAFVFVLPTSSTHRVNVPKGCIAVASYAFKTDWKKTDLVDAKLFKNAISCIHELIIIIIGTYIAHFSW